MIQSLRDRDIFELLSRLTPERTATRSEYQFINLIFSVSLYTLEDGEWKILHHHFSVISTVVQQNNEVVSDVS